MDGAIDQRLGVALATEDAEAEVPPLKRNRRGGFVRFAAIGALLIVFVVFAIAAPGFLTRGNLTNVVEQSTVLALLAFGMSIVIIGGGGDVIPEARG